MRDYHVFFVSDGTETFPIGDLTVEQIKKATLTTLQLAFAEIISAADLVELIRRNSSRKAAAA